MDENNPALDNVRLVDPASPPASLFHGTGIYNLASIIEENTLNSGGHWGKPNEPHGPRTSLSKKVADKFIFHSTHEWEEYASGGILEFSGHSLIEDFDLVNYWDTYHNGGFMEDELEVAILTDKVTNLDRYLIAIHCEDNDIKWALDERNMQMANQFGGWPFSGERQFEMAERCLNILWRHPARISLDLDNQPVTFENLMTVTCAP